MTLRAYLERRGESATAFADRCGVSRELVYEAVRGVPVRTRRTAERIRAATGDLVELSDLLDPPGEPLPVVEPAGRIKSAAAE